MKRNDIMMINSALTYIKRENPTKVRLNHYIDINLSEIKTIIDSYSNITNKILEYNKERENYCKRLCKKDENDQPIIIDNSYEIEDMELFDKEINELKTTYNMDELNSFFEQDEEKEIKFIPIPLNLFPEDMDNASDIMSVLQKLIKL